MTIRVVVKNDDDVAAESGNVRPNVVVVVHDMDKKTGVRTACAQVTLKPGESRAFYIHLLRDLMVSEVVPSS